MKPIYIKNFVAGANELFIELMNLNWLDAKAARKEYFMSDEPRTYLYGKMDYEYASSPFSRSVAAIMEQLAAAHNVCFLNRYDEAHNALGWHADDSFAVDGAHPIAVVSLGSEREIWWKKRDFKGEVPEENKQLLEHGSLFIMPAGFQTDHLHKIPKHDRPCGTRISLTFRRYLSPEEVGAAAGAVG